MASVIGSQSVCTTPAGSAVVRIREASPPWNPKIACQSSPTPIRVAPSPPGLGPFCVVRACTNAAWPSASSVSGPGGGRANRSLGVQRRRPRLPRVAAVRGRSRVLSCPPHRRAAAAPWADGLAAHGATRGSSLSRVEASAVAAARNVVHTGVADTRGRRAGGESAAEGRFHGGGGRGGVGQHRQRGWCPSPAAAPSVPARRRPGQCAAPRLGRGVQEDQRVSPALEGSVGSAKARAFVNLPVRPFVPVAAGPSWWWWGISFIRASVQSGAGSAAVVKALLGASPWA